MVNNPTDAQLPDNIKVLKNGTLYDMTKKRFVGMRLDLAEKPTVITAENAPEYHSLARSRRRELLKEAAAEAVEDGRLRTRYGSDAWIAEIGAAMQRKATNIDDPKMVDAARFLMQETEVGVKMAVEQGQTVTHIHQMDAATVALLERIARQQAAEVVDGETVDE